MNISWRKLWLENWNAIFDTFFALFSAKYVRIRRLFLWTFSNNFEQCPFCLHIFQINLNVVPFSRNFEDQEHEHGHEFVYMIENEPCEAHSDHFQRPWNSQSYGNYELHFSQIAHENRENRVIFSSFVLFLEVYWLGSILCSAMHETAILYHFITSMRWGFQYDMTTWQA